MKIGKISESVLKRTVIKEIKYKNKSVRQGAAVGVDGAVFKTDGRDMVSSVSTYTGEIVMCAKRAFAASVNSVAAMEAKPFAVMASVIMPESAKEIMLRSFMTQLHDMGEAIGVQIAGGHTETVSGIEKPVVTLTAYGYRDSLPAHEGLDNGYDIVMIGEAGLEGTAVIAAENEEELCKRFSSSYIKKAKEYINELVIVKEAAAAVQHGEKAMHDISKGGVFTALWELAERMKCGIEINLRAIPIRQETIELCEYFDLNPYFISSSGGLLVAAENGADLADKANAMAKSAAVIGHTCAGHAKTIINNDEVRYLESPRAGRKEDICLN